MKKEEIKFTINSKRELKTVRRTLEMLGEDVTLIEDITFTPATIFFESNCWNGVYSESQSVSRRNLKEVTFKELLQVVSCDQSHESILDGKVAIQVNNDREFELLMKHYKSKGWSTSNEGNPFLSVSKLYPFFVSYNNGYSIFKYVYIGQKDIPKTIRFSDFAKEVGIKVPVFVMKSEDGVDLYEDSEVHSVRLIKNEWSYFAGFSSMKGDVLWNINPESNNSIRKIFSTKEAAEAWIVEQNKPKMIRLFEDTNIPVIITKDKVRLDLSKIKGKVIETRIEPNELEQIYEAYQSL